ncbi:hypothetical protein [Leifsonia sp. AG29]|uniref:hypothetical protein n=1 Tax=Leifsonia sp. AG29 TaxID=2598860 RepID=UPI00131CF915|nr:hypothetical protein [Leifsonia sp. AG29]
MIEEPRSGHSAVRARVTEYAAGGGLDDLIRGGIRSDQVATVLIGVARGLAALHGAGLGGAVPAVGTVHLRENGCPAIAVGDALRPLNPVALADDVSAFRSLARELCAQATAAGLGSGGGTLLVAVERGLVAAGWGFDADFSSIEAPALAWERVVEAVLGQTEPAALHGQTAAARAAPGQQASPRREGRRSAASLAPVGDRANRILAFLDGRPGAQIGSRVSGWVKARPRLVVAAAVPVIGAVAVLLLVPSERADGGHASRPPAAEASPAVTASSVPGSADAFRPPTPRSTDPVPGDSSPHATPGPGPSDGRTDLAGPDADPVDATAALLQARHACFAARSPDRSCLAEVFLDDGEALALESAQLTEPGGADARDYSGSSISLVDRWADAALVAVAPDRERTPKSGPASLLVVRSEAGWRVRAIFP